MSEPTLARWDEVMDRVDGPDGEVTIGVVGKYTSLIDSYKSLSEALAHGGIANNVRVKLDWMDSEIFESEDAVTRLEGVHGILVPGGFGERGIEGKVEAIRFARERNIPFFGICLGMQCAVIEFARSVVQLTEANSTEFCKDTPHPVICLLDEQKTITDKGGTMRLGAHPARLEPDSRAAACSPRLPTRAVESIGPYRQSRYDRRTRFRI